MQGEIQDELNEIWGNWKIKKFLGEGAFGKVYQIEKKEFDYVYKAALKVISIPKSQDELSAVLNELADERSVTEYYHEIVGDIVKEIALMSRLKGNTNIVSYEDHAVIPNKDGIGWNIYIRMELLTPLFEYTKDQELSIRDVIQLGIDMCKALEVCQKYNIIHRDIKPENIFVSDMGNFKLGDFGISRQMEKTVLEFSKKGTYSYMAPEVYKGENYNSTVDIYSLGIVLYRFLNNNRLPFLPDYPQKISYSDRSKALMMRTSGKEMPLPCNAEGRLAEIVLKACAYQPKERYESAVDMRKALEAILYDKSLRDIAYPKGDILCREDSKEALEEREYSESVEDTTETVCLFPWNETTIKNETEVVTDFPMNTEKNILEGKDKNVTSQIEDKLKTKQSFLKKIKKCKGILLPVILICIASAGAIYFVFGNNKTSITTKNKKQTVEVPRITEIEQEEAQKILEDKNLELYIKSEQYSDEVKKGFIISQTPQAGETLQEHSKVEVVLSKGIKQVKVPDIIGETEKAAIKKLKSAKLNYSISREYNSKVLKGRVIGQNIKKGKYVNKGKKIKIKISLGTKAKQISKGNSVTPSKSANSSKSTSQKSQKQKAPVTTYRSTQYRRRSSQYNSTQPYSTTEQYNNTTEPSTSEEIDNGDNVDDWDLDN